MSTTAFPYRGELEWVEASSILLARHGSHAYGLNREGSDEDFKGVVIPPPAVLFSMRRPFAQAESAPPDVVLYDVRKFLRLAADCNPNIIEVLWVTDDDLLVCTKLGRRLLDSRERFLSRRVRHTFAGYAVAQLKRIRTHRRWLTHPPSAPPKRGDFGLLERTTIPKDQLAAAQAAIEKQLDRWQLNDVDGLPPSTRIAVAGAVAELQLTLGIDDEARHHAAAKKLGFDSNFVQLLDQERRYNAAQREWEQFRDWQKSRNRARAALEARHGYDTKHAMHLVRLLRMCREILETGQVLVRRPDRDDLLAIRDGAWSYDDLIAWSKEQDEVLSGVLERSPLPPAPDMEAIDALCVELIEDALG